MADDYGTALAGLTYPTVLSRMGVEDPDEVRGDQGKQADLYNRLQGPAQAQPVQLAQNAPPARPGASQPDPRTAIPAGEPPDPVLRTRPPASAPAAATPRAATTAPAPAPSVPAVSQSGAAPVDTAGAAGLMQGWQQKAAQQAVTGELSAADMARKNYAEAPPPPDTTTIDTRIENESQPGYDPSTGQVVPLRDSSGKISQQYRPGFWGELKRVGSNALAGASGQMDKVTPYGAPNGRWREDEEYRGQHLALDQQRKADTLARFKAAMDARNAQSTGMEKVAPLYGAAAGHATDSQKAQTDENRYSPEGEAAVQTAKDKAGYDSRVSDLNQLQQRAGPGRTIPAEAAAEYLLTGKMPNPREPRQATAEEIELSGAIRTLGHTPSHQEYMDIVDEIRGHGGGGDDPGGIVADATGKKQEFIDSYDRQPDGSYLKKGVDPNKPKRLLNQSDSLTGQQFNDKVDQFRLDANKALTKHGASIDAQGNLVRGGNQPANGAPAGSGAPQTTTARPPAALLRRTPEGRTVYGRNGEAFKKVRGQWQPQP